jgi:nucleoside-diphosphate-sugar epimerase
VSRVLLTGAGGFIGRACVGPLLAAGFEVHALSREQRIFPPGVTAWQGNLLDPAEPARLMRAIRPTHLLHAAWDVTHGNFWTAQNNLNWLAASVHLLTAFLESGGQRAVGVGTCAEYAWTEATLEEISGPSAAATPYGRCKRALGDAYAAAAGLGLSTAWARLFFPYGPGDSPQRLVPALMASLAAGKRFPTTAGTQVRDFIYIEDVGQALSALLASSVQGAVNIGTGHGVPLARLINTIANEMGRPELVELGAMPLRPGDPAELIADASRLHEEVGFRARFNLQEGLARAVAAFRQEAGES